MRESRGSDVRVHRAVTYRLSTLFRTVFRVLICFRLALQQRAGDRVAQQHAALRERPTENYHITLLSSASGGAREGGGSAEA